ncbi:MAG: hypothetical protein M1827_004191 [Pycnora praestabilis]|nr:MAG: hypothetical protein M1827_004191 [Pycnora praestabilis]
MEERDPEKDSAVLDKEESPSSASSGDHDLEISRSPSSHLAKVATVEDAAQKPPPASVVSRSVSIIPRSKRRGLLGRFTVVPEVAEPQFDYKRSIKWFITFVIAAAAAAAPMGSAIFYPALPELSKDLHSTPTVVNLSVAFYMLSMSIFPLWWSSFSESLGRRTIYIVSFLLFLLWNILSAVSTSIGMLIVMRILGGGAAASVQAVGAGTIADIWEVRERGRAMGIFYLGPLCGPLLAPIIGGALAQKFGWRSTQWFLAIYGGVILTLIFFCLPETLKNRLPVVERAEETIDNPVASEKGPTRPALISRTSTCQSVQLKTKKWVTLAKRIFIDPLRIILYLRFPAIVITVYYASITFGSLYVLNISVQSTFSRPPYDFSTVIVGLTYLPSALGYVLASVFGGRWTDYIMHREAKAAGRYDEHGKLMLIPEDRMRENAWLAAFIYPAALVWYGWTVQKGVYWLVPLIGNFFFGIGSMLIFSMATTMLTEFMPRKSSNGVAVNNFMRNIFSCVGGIVAQPLIDVIGNGWLFTGLGVIAACSGVVVWAMRKFGPRWRVTMEKALG